MEKKRSRPNQRQATRGERQKGEGTKRNKGINKNPRNRKN